MEDLAKMVPLAQSGILSPDSFLKGCERLVKRHAAGAAEGGAPAKTLRVEGQPTSNLPGRQPSETVNAAVARRRLLNESPQATSPCPVLSRSYLRCCGLPDGIGMSPSFRVC